MLGQWKNFEEIEESLNINELQAILEAARKQEKDRQIFAAALKGITLDKEETGTTFEDIKRRAEAKARGISEEAYELGEIGIQIIEE